MTKTVALLQLAERCENATGPDRELDVLIVAAVHLKQLTYQSPEWIKDPEFTASLDAAMQLVPEGWEVHNFDDWTNAPPPYWSVDLWLINRPHHVCQGIAATAPLALCVAALKALASQGNNNATS